MSARARALGSRIWLVVVVAYLCVTFLAIRAPETALQSIVPPAPIDLLAFYCAGKVARTGADPYLSEPLRTCEHEAFTERTGHVSRYPDLVVPAPLPPYVLVLLEPLGAVPFGLARAFFCATVVAAAFALVAALTALARRYALIFALGVAASVLLPALQLGQIASLAIAALALAAWAARAGRIGAASCAGAFTLIEPHLGLPTVAAMFLCIPRSRRTLAALCAGVALLTLTGGLERNLEYLSRVVPAQARAEGTEFTGQYSLAALLAHLGVPDALALAAGSASYAFMLIAGSAVAFYAQRKTGDVAFGVAVAPAFTLLGGTYVHIHNMAAGLPLAAALLGSGRRALVPALAAFGLLVPWDIVEKTGVLSWYTALPPHDAHAALAEVAGPERLAEDVWGVWVRSDPNGNRPAAELLLFKVPTWLSLIALCGSSLRVALSAPTATPPSAARSLPERR